MANSDAVVTVLNHLMDERDRTHAWVARAAHLPYKRVLSEVKNRTTPIKLETAIAVAEALGSDLPHVLDEAAA